MFEFNGLRESPSNDSGTRVEDVKPGEFLVTEDLAIFNLEPKQYNPVTTVPFLMGKPGEKYIKQVEKGSGGVGNFQLRKDGDDIKIIDPLGVDGISYYDPNGMCFAYQRVAYPLQEGKIELLSLKGKFFTVIVEDNNVFMVPLTTAEYQTNRHPERYDVDKFHMKMQTLEAIAREKIGRLKDK